MVRAGGAASAAAGGCKARLLSCSFVDARCRGGRGEGCKVVCVQKKGATRNPGGGWHALGASQRAGIERRLGYAMHRAEGGGPAPAAPTMEERRGTGQKGETAEGVGWGSVSQVQRQEDRSGWGGGVFVLVCINVASVLHGLGPKSDARPNLKGGPCWEGEAI